MKAELKVKDIPLTGKLITSEDPALIGENFQSLQNLRYMESHLRAIGGMEKVNTTALTTYLKIRSLYHFRKEQPTESHLLAQAYNAGLTGSQVIQNTTAIPDQGDFSGTALHVDATGASVGHFSKSPNSQVTYCNSVETLIWGGDEMRCSGYANYDPDGTFFNDFTNEVRNTKDDSLNVAKSTAVSAGIDANTMLLLSFNNNVTDTSPTTIHTVTNNNVTFDATNKVFGSHAASFNGTTAYLTVPDDADFDFSGGSFTIDGRFRVTSLATNNILYYQQTDANNYFKFYIDTDGAVILSIYAASAEVVAVTTADIIVVDTYYHLELVEDDNEFYIFIDGIQQAYTSDASRAADFTGLVQIGYDNTAFYAGQIDEYRVSNSARHIAAFEILPTAYTTSTTITYTYIGSRRPLKSIKLYIKTANTATSTLTGEYFNGTIWTELTTLVDGTADGGISLAQTGSITFDDTENTAKVKVIEGKYLYWYKLRITEVDTAASIYFVTMDASFQEIKDIWDGAPRSCLSFQVYNWVVFPSYSSYQDNTVNVYEEDYSSANTATYADIGSLITWEHLAAGFPEQLLGVEITLVPGSGNSTRGTIATVSYWDGSGWASVGTITDETIEEGVSFSKSGVISWTPPALSSEFKTSIAKNYPYYYYKISFNVQLSANVKIDLLTGIPAQTIVSAYKFPMMAQERLFLCCDTKGNKNSARCTARYTSSVLTGEDTLEFEFGDSTELTAATYLYNQFGSALYDIILFFKANSTWIVTGAGPASWVKYEASDKIGCVASQTLQICHAAHDLTINAHRSVAIWQGSDGIYMFDGKSIIPIHHDISNFFDKRDSNPINTSKIEDSTSFFDEQEQEYHWCFASGSSTTLNEEWVYDLRKQRWYEVERGSTKKIQAACTPIDTSGNKYNYGTIETGYVQRLEYTNAFDGDDMTFSFHTGDMALGGSFLTESNIRKIKFGTVAKATTTNEITLAHYKDTNTTGTTKTLSPAKSGYRIADALKGDNWTGTLHSFKFSMTTNDEVIGFEPLHFAIAYKPIRIDMN